MQFLKINDEEFNVGMILRIDCRPWWVDDVKDASYQAYEDGRDLYGDSTKKIAMPCARIYVFGREQPILILEEDTVAALERFWDQREVITFE